VRCAAATCVRQRTHEHDEQKTWHVQGRRLTAFTHAMLSVSSMEREKRHTHTHTHTDGKHTRGPLFAWRACAAQKRRSPTRTACAEATLVPQAAHRRQRRCSVRGPTVTCSARYTGVLQALHSGPPTAAGDWPEPERGDACWDENVAGADPSRAKPEGCVPARRGVRGDRVCGEPCGWRS
jgi:hypothetical protein